MNTLNVGNEELISIDNHKIKSLQKTVDNVNNGLLHNVTIPHNIKKSQKPNILFNNSSISSIKGIREESPLSDEFFSNKNIQGLQKSIRFQIYNQTKKIIDNQSTNELLTIMRSIFLQFSDNSINSIDFLSHVLELNQKVIDFSVDQINTQITQYDGYIKKLSTLPTPIERPQQVDRNNFTYKMDNLME